MESQFCVLRSVYDGEPLLQCEECKIWSHIACVGVTISDAQGMKFSCQECRAGRNQDGKGERNLGEEGHKEKNGVRKSEMDKRRKQAQDKVVGEVLEKAKEDGYRALKEIDEDVKESYAAEKREKSISDTNTAHSVKGMATRVRAALADEEGSKLEISW